LILKTLLLIAHSRHKLLGIKNLIIGRHIVGRRGYTNGTQRLC
jgi:hypothetical protein